MPQLDKYIFFNHIITLTLFFYLIYIFVRKSVVPDISTILKYRKKRVNSFTKEFSNYEKNLTFSKVYFEDKSKDFSNKTADNLEKLIYSYNALSSKELYKIYRNNLNTLKNVTILNFISKNKTEFKRLFSL